MGTTNRSTVRVLNFHGDENERIDQDHFDTLASIAADAKRRLQRFIGERRLSPVDVGGVPTTDNAAVMGSVIAVGDAAFTIDGVDLVLSASETTPLEFLIASSIGGSGTAAAGDIMQFGGTDTVAFTLPTSGHPRMILARVVDALSEDPDSGWVRRKWNDTVNPPAGAEVEESGWLGIQERVIEWADTDNSLADADPNSTWSKMALGFQKVALVTLTAPATLSTSWQRLLPAVTDVTRLPGGELASIAQALSAIVFQIEAIIGAGWDTAPATTILATAFKDTAQDITLGLHAARLAAVEGRATVLEAVNANGRLDCLEAQDVCSGYLKPLGGPAPSYLGYDNVVSVSRTGIGVHHVTMANGLSTFLGSGYHFGATLHYTNGVIPATGSRVNADIVWVDDTHFEIHLTGITILPEDLPTDVGLMFRLQTYVRP